MENKNITKLDINKAKEIVAKLGCKLLSTEWNGAGNKYIFQCKCGEIFTRRYMQVVKGSVTCLKCKNEVKENQKREYRKIKYKEIKHFIEIESNSNCKLLSKDYINMSTKMMFRCPCGNEFETTYRNFLSQNKRCCDECTKKKIQKKFAHTYEYVKSYIEDNDCKLLSKEYINHYTMLKIKCLKCGHVFFNTFTCFQISKHKCPNCAIKATSECTRLNINYVTNYIEKKGYELLNTYINCDTNLKIMCPKGHITYMDFYHFKNRGQRCKICYKLKDKGGKNSASWKGGITEFSFCMRQCTKQWVRDSLKNANYKCQITGKKGKLNVHHTYPFHKILKETLLELNLDMRNNLGDYTQEELNEIKLLLVKKHKSIDCGFVMLKSIHQLFHKTYGYKNTTREQLDEFILKYNKKIIN